MSVLTMNGYEIVRGDEEYAEYSGWNTELLPDTESRKQMPPDLLGVDVETFLARMYENQ